MTDYGLCLSLLNLEELGSNLKSRAVRLIGFHRSLSGGGGRRYFCWPRSRAGGGLAFWEVIEHLSIDSLLEDD